MVEWIDSVVTSSWAKQVELGRNASPRRSYLRDPLRLCHDNPYVLCTRWIQWISWYPQELPTRYVEKRRKKNEPKRKEWDEMKKDRTEMKKWNKLGQRIPKTFQNVWEQMCRTIVPLCYVIFSFPTSKRISIVVLAFWRRNKCFDEERLCFDEQHSCCSSQHRHFFTHYLLCPVETFSEDKILLFVQTVFLRRNTKCSYISEFLLLSWTIQVHGARKGCRWYPKVSRYLRLCSFFTRSLKMSKFSYWIRSCSSLKPCFFVGTCLLFVETPLPNSHVFWIGSIQRDICSTFTNDKREWEVCNWATILHHAWNIHKYTLNLEHNLVTEGADKNSEYKILRFFARMPAMLIAQVADGKDVVGMEKLKYQGKEITIKIAKEVCITTHQLWQTTQIKTFL